MLNSIPRYLYTLWFFFNLKETELDIELLQKPFNSEDLDKGFEKGKERKVLDLEEFKVCEIVWSAANCLVVRHQGSISPTFFVRLFLYKFFGAKPNVTRENDIRTLNIN